MRIKGSHIWAVAITLAIGGWLMSGQMLKEPAGKGDTQTAPSNKPALTRVQVRLLHAEPYKAQLVIRGHTETPARVKVQAQTSGQVVELAVRKGQFVKKGALLCRLDMGARQAALTEAQAALAQARLDYSASDTLARQGFSARTTKAADKARLDRAMAAVARARLDIGYTRITAPFDGLVEDLPAKTGALLRPGGNCASMIVPDPMLFVGRVSERDVGSLAPGMTGTVTLVTGKTATGTLRFISPSAEAATRTFKVEMVMDNAGHRLRDGVTARATVSLKPVMAQRFSPALLVLNDAGELGVRTVTANDTVRFVPVTLLAENPAGVWVSGLPETTYLITVGQGYVADGQRVAPVTEMAENGS